MEYYIGDIQFFAQVHILYCNCKANIHITLVIDILQMQHNCICIDKMIYRQKLPENIWHLQNKIVTLHFEKNKHFTNMKDRIFELMKMVGKNPTDFATTIEISPAVLSSIKSGRTKPTLFLVEKIKSVYPNVNVNWLITGEGEMFMDREQGELAVNNEAKPVRKETPEVAYVNTVQTLEQSADREESEMLNEPEVIMKVENKKRVKEQDQWQVKTVIKPDDRKISQIIVLYNDGTFESLSK